MTSATGAELDLLGMPSPAPPKKRSRARKPKPQWSLHAFGAKWCAPWPLVNEMLDELEASGVPVVRVDVDADPTSAERFRIISLPTILVLREGVERRRVVGAISAAELRAHVSA